VENIIFEKSENDLGTCRLQVTVIFASPSVEK